MSAFFDYIEGNTLTAKSFAGSVDKFLAFDESRILEDYGSISRK